MVARQLGQFGLYYNDDLIPARAPQQKHNVNGNLNLRPLGLSRFLAIVLGIILFSYTGRFGHSTDIYILIIITQGFCQDFRRGCGSFPALLAGEVLGSGVIAFSLTYSMRPSWIGGIIQQRYQGNMP